MVEGLFVQQYNGCFTAEMIAMADLALLGGHIRYPAMESFFLFNIVGNIFMVMALEAKVALMGLLKELVALGALRLELGMCLGQQSRHQRQLHGINQICFNSMCTHDHHRDKKYNFANVSGQEPILPVEPKNCQTNASY